MLSLGLQSCAFSCMFSRVNVTYTIQLLFCKCSHEIKRLFLLGRKAMTKLDSILKSRDITLPTKVHIVKTVVFPVVVYLCESWTRKKAEC